jgi:hypothetical protein
MLGEGKGLLFAEIGAGYAISNGARTKLSS